jgi:hypothetical protein
MGKGSGGFGGLKNAGAWPGWGARDLRCVGCHRTIFYGERCPPCARMVKLKAAKRRRKR